MSTYKQVFEKNKYNLPEVVNKSKTWFNQQALLLSKQNLQPIRLIQSSTDKNRSQVTPGDMYLFMYRAEHRDTLPYWDMFPLVFPFRRLKDGFIGLNMHYLPYQMRIVLLDRLMDIRTDKSITENTRLRFSWSTIQGASKLKLAEPCVHRYLGDNLMTPLKRIDPQDWTTALFLPIESFVGASKTTVWRNI